MDTAAKIWMGSTVRARHNLASQLRCIRHFWKINGLSCMILDLWEHCNNRAIQVGGCNIYTVVHFIFLLVHQFVLEYAGSSEATEKPLFQLLRTHVPIKITKTIIESRKLQLEPCSSLHDRCCDLHKGDIQWQALLL